MQTSMIPWHIFMNALAQQHRPQMKNWLDRWRFANDGVFMAHDPIDATAETQTVDGSARGDSIERRVIN